ncbi:MAG: hypothetical protein FWH55_07925 [Oscillospiraceae bacterium]|nr:hypothetical protein [Oscillospiraceae bacterium]
MKENEMKEAENNGKYYRKSKNTAKHESFEGQAETAKKICQDKVLEVETKHSYSNRDNRDKFLSLPVEE